MEKSKNTSTLSDIAEAANCSVVTVSNVINGKGRVSDKTRLKIEKLAKKI